MCKLYHTVFFSHPVCLRFILVAICSSSLLIWTAALYSILQIFQNIFIFSLVDYLGYFHFSPPNKKYCTDHSFIHLLVYIYESFPSKYNKKWNVGDFPGDEWLRLHTPSAGASGSIPGQETRFHMLQLKRSCMVQLKISHAATKT